MEAKVDAVGRIVLPKALRRALGLTTGSRVDVSLYGSGLQVVPESRTARIETRGRRKVAISKTRVSDEDVFRLIDGQRR